ncbi:MAG: hypothetical protein Kow0029_15790 [Candidatus Rifleibacteriota bacterium]
MFFPLHDQNNEAVKAVPIVSYLIIGICLIVQLFQMILGLSDPSRKQLTHFIYRHGMVPAAFFSGSTKYQIGPKEIQISEEELNRLKKFPANSKEKYYAEMIEVNSSRFWLWLMPLTNIFMHAGWMHILSNIWFFWIFSDNVEEKMGPFKFLLFYVICGIAASLGHAVFSYDSTVPLVGASGAISAVMGAYVVMFPANRITTYFCPVWFFIRRIDVPAYVVLGMYLLINFLAMTSVKLGNVAFDAHIFGFIAGLAIAFAYKKATAA